MNYFSEFKDERFHDNNLIALLQDLNSINANQLFSDSILDGKPLGRLIEAKRKKDYDVSLQYENAECIIETKVDSPEGGYFSEDKDRQSWKIKKKYLKIKQNQYFLFLTYGTSEFYIYKCEDGYRTGCNSKIFKHIKLGEIAGFIKKAIQLIHDKDNKYNVWSSYLNYEITKRNDYKYYLNQVHFFRSKYLSTIESTDWPNNRVHISVPEFLAIFYSKIAVAWNSSKYAKQLGKVCVYPMGRQIRVNDIILNFWEIWEKQSSTFGKLLKPKNEYSYFEFNEDFNLHLKLKSEVKPETVDEIRDFLIKKHFNLSMRKKYPSMVEHYKQGSYVVYEWDVNLLDYLEKEESLLPVIAEIISNCLEIIK